MEFDNPIEFLREVIAKKEAAGPVDDRDATLGVLTAVMETLVENKVEIALALLREATKGIHEQAEIIGSYDNEMIIRDRWGQAINIGREDWTRIAEGMLKEAGIKIDNHPVN
jgi:hypothetical protein